MSSPEVVVTAMAARTPVGANAEMSSKALAAGVIPFAEYPYILAKPDDPEWEADLPILVAAVPPLEAQYEREQRLFALASPVINELFANSQLKRTDLSRTGFYFSLPSALMNGKPIGISEQWHRRLLKELGLSQASKVSLSNEGRTACFAVLEQAAKDLQTGLVEYAIVIAADTYIDTACLKALDSVWRLKTERNVDGFIPGESATAFLLEKSSSAQERGLSAMAALGPHGYGQEPQSFQSAKQSSGTGLTDAIRGAVVNVGERKLENVYCDLNGESYAAYEWGLMLTRCAPILEGMSNLYHPADACGDSGAAAGGLLLLQAISHLQAKGQPGNPVCHLLWTASDEGHRRAITVNQIR